MLNVHFFKLHEKIRSFWERHPALLLGLSCYAGAAFTLYSPLFFILFILTIQKKKVLLQVLLFLLPCCTLYNFYAFPKDGDSVKGIFTIHSIQETKRLTPGWNYMGILKTKEGDFYCRCFNKTYFSPSLSYHIEGRVRALSKTHYTLKSTKMWLVHKKRLNLVAWRLSAHAFLKTYIETRYEPQSASFLVGLMTGKVEDRLLYNAFGELGLTHLMAISGFHFGLLTALLHLVLRTFLPPKLEAALLMIALTGYYLFVGEGPSLFRAWMMIIVFLLGLLLERRCSPLNALGIALLFSIVADPLVVATLSFQLSFLATAGILFLYSSSEKLLRLWIPKYNLCEVIDKAPLWKWAYISLSLFRASLSLLIAVNVAVLPLQIFHFHLFSINSFFYNLFFPLLSALALLLFLLSMCFGEWLHRLNHVYCHSILKIIETPPLLFNKFFINPLPHSLLFFSLTLLLFLSILIKEQTIK